LRERESEKELFTHSEVLLVLDYFCVPSALAEPGWSFDRVALAGLPLTALACVGPAANRSGALFWVPTSAANSTSGAFKLGSIPIFGRLLPDSETRSWFESPASAWTRSVPICDRRGARVASIWKHEDGSVFLPFDPNEVVERYWSESYEDYLGSTLNKRLRSASRRAYYRLRPIIPRGGQILMRRSFSHVQSRTPFPRWPIETGLHDFYALMFDLLAGLAGEAVPTIAPWPHGYDWAFVLTHDVETTAGYANITLLRDVEVDASYRSSWNLVPKNHDPHADGLVAELQADGFEIGVHGLYHDGRDVSELNSRLPLIHEYAERWGAAGFRSPATLRDWKSFRRLEFDYDSTYHDTAPYEPQPGGCGSWLPYMNGDLVELPITLAQDHTLFEILGGFDENLWLEKARFLRSRGGMALVLTHPDYAQNERLVGAYRRLLGEFAEDETAWKALPREVSRWWRLRAGSTLERVAGGWRVVGPASEAGRVMLVGAPG
jgi:hypothetical protein